MGGIQPHHAGPGRVLAEGGVPVKKMTAEHLDHVLSLIHGAMGRSIPGELLEHISALEAEVAQARDRALEDVCKGLAKQADDLARAGEDEAPELINSLHDWVWSLKSNPEPGVADYCPEARPREMASEANGLLPKKRRREHEYGTEYKAEFGTVVANCTRGRCQAYRVRSRDGKHTYFSNGRPGAEKTDAPGPCEVEP